ncbi:MAG: hypothetical protein QXE32_03575 [Sulfolobales archaeon]
MIESLLVVAVGLVQGLNIFSISILIFLISLLLNLGFSGRRFLYLSSLYLVTYFSSSLVLLFLFVRFFSFLSSEALRIITVAMSLLMILLGVLILLYILEPENRFLRIFTVNPLQKHAKSVTVFGPLIIPPLLGIISGLSSLVCPCTAPLIPVAASYIASNKIHESFHDMILYAISVASPSTLIVILVSLQKIQRIVTDLIRLNMLRIRIVTSLLIIIIGFILLFLA